MYLSSKFRHSTNVGDIEIIYATRQIASVLVNEMDTSNIDKLKLTDSVSIPQVQEYLNDVTVLNTCTGALGNPFTNDYIIIPEEGMKATSLSIPGPDRRPPHDSFDTLAKKHFNVHVNNTTVILSPKDSLASILTEVPKFNLPILMYARVADALQYPGVINSFNTNIKSIILPKLLARI